EHTGKLGMDWDRQDRASLLLPHMQRAVANVLLAHADHIATPLASVECERQRQALTRADGMKPLKLSNLFLGPTVMPVGLDRSQPNAKRRIVFQQFQIIDAMPDQCADRLEPIPSGAWCHAVEQRADEFFRHSGDQLVAMFAPEGF